TASTPVNWAGQHTVLATRVLHSPRAADTLWPARSGFAAVGTRVMERLRRRPTWTRSPPRSVASCWITSSSPARSIFPALSPSAPAPYNTARPHQSRPAAADPSSASAERGLARWPRRRELPSGWPRRDDAITSPTALVTYISQMPAPPAAAEAARHVLTR